MLSEPSDKLKAMSQKLSVKNKVAEKLRMDVHSETSIRVIQNPIEAEHAGLHLDFVQATTQYG